MSNLWSAAPNHDELRLVNRYVAVTAYQTPAGQTSPRVNACRFRRLGLSSPNNCADRARPVQTQLQEAIIARLIMGLAYL